MNNKGTIEQTKFVEVQYFWQQPLAWFVWILAIAMLYWLSSSDLILETFAIVTIVIVLAILLLVFFTTLKTEISSEGIGYRMWPFHTKKKLIPWSEIESAEVKQYKPLRDYGGWGMRISTNGRAYNIKGNIGIQIQLISGKSLLIGTQKGREVEHVLAAFR